MAVIETGVAGKSGGRGTVVSMYYMEEESIFNFKKSP